MMEKMKHWKEAIWLTFREFMLNTTLHGYRHLVEVDRHWFERVLWIATEILATWAVVYSILDVYTEYMATPMVTTVESTQYPIWNVPFPAVGLCNINKISKSKARAFAAELRQYNLQYSEEELFKLLRYFGRMYDQQVRGYDHVKELHKVLSTWRPKYDVSALMKQLAPNCDDILISCMWKGKKEPCGNMFELINTLNGYCCVFNYMKPNDGSENWKPKAGQRLTAAGYKMGLNVLIDPQREDYFYPTFPTYGTQLIVFDQKDHPDTPSGLIEKLIPLNTEIFFTMAAFSRYSVPELRNIDPITRACFFEDETSHVIPGEYNYGRCLSRCSVTSILRLCGCLPFYFENSESTRICDLQDILCLFKNKENFQNHRPKGWSTDQKAKDEPDETLSCEDCLPSCSDTRYEIMSSYARIGIPSYHRSKLTEGVNITYNHSIIHLYYPNIDTTLYKQDILFSWYELVSHFGGICSLFNGFSFISVIEIFYFFSLRFFYISKREDENDPTLNNSKTLPQKMESAEKQKPVYWNEIGPRY